VRPLSFVDDISSTAARGNSVRELCEKLQKASEAAIEWAKTEALLFTRKRGQGLREQVRRARIIVCMGGVCSGSHSMPGGLARFRRRHHQTRLAKARKAKARIRTLCRRENPSDSGTSSIEKRTLTFLQSCQQNYSI
jgi:hypothetical protein